MDPADGGAHRIPLEEFRQSWSGVLLLVAPDSEIPPVSGANTNAVARFWKLAAPHRAMMAQAAFGAIAYTLLGLSISIFVQKVVDYVIPDGNRDLLDLLTMMMVGLLAVQVYLRCVKDLLVLRTGQRIDAGLLLGYYQHLLRLPQRFFDTMRVGEIVSRLNDAVKIRAFVNEVSLELLVNVLVVVFSFSLMLVYSPELAALVSASVPLYLLLYWVTNRVNRVHQRRTMEAAADLEAHVVESVGAITTIRRLGVESHNVFGAETRLVRLLRPVHAVGWSSALSGSAGELVARASTIALLWFGAILVLRQVLTPGELMSFYALNGHLTPPVLGLIAANRQVQDALVAADRLFEIIDLEQEDDSGVVDLSERDFEVIRFRDVYFGYGNRPPLFRGLSLTLRQGELTAIVGESGSGKSTLAALAQRIHIPQAGQISYGRIDVRHIRRTSLLAAVSVVPQEVVLFTGSLLDNLAPGELQPDVERVAAIIDRLGLRDFVDSLPTGLATPIGERGLSLSGGQRQRVAIARALYRRPRVLILDEATSGLDATGEASVIRTLRQLQYRGMTIVMITHRLTSATHADRILVLERGALAEDGSHGELIAKGGSYYNLWQHQTGGLEFNPQGSRGENGLSGRQPWSSPTPA